MKCAVLRRFEYEYEYRLAPEYEYEVFAIWEAAYRGSFLSRKTFTLSVFWL